MKQLIKTLATSSTALIFVVVGITGIFMYFHLFDGYTEDVHEILGLAFFVAVVLHVYFNWKSMKNYFGKKVFLAIGAIVAIVTASFVLPAKGGNPRMMIVHSTLEAPLELSSQILHQDLATATTRLNEKQIEIPSPSSSIKEIAKANQVSPFMVVDLIVGK